jgi:type I restriction enzyme S subunit
MSGIAFLEKLLDGAGVEWKTLGEVTRKISSGGTPKTGVAEYWEGGTIPWMSSGEVNLETIHGTENFITEAGLNSSSAKLVPKNSLVIALAGQGKTRGKVARTRIELATNQSLASIVVDEGVVNPDYLYYFIKTQYENLRQISSGGDTRGGLNLQMIAKYKFPLPCPENPKKSLAIQTEIARILDTFADLTAALTAALTTELSARKKQYNYYRDQLFCFEDDEVEWRTLSEVAIDFGRGKSRHRPRNDERLYGGGIPFIQTGDIRNASHTITQYSQTYSEFGLRQSKLWPMGTLCITIAANIAETSILGFDACFPDSVIGFVADPKKTSADYVEYLLQSTKKELEDKGKEKSSAQSNINLETFEQLKLPFPSLEEQARIVAILNKFNALTSSITEGLPREIELRQKQYEHYRNLLLNFPKPEAAPT